MEKEVRNAVKAKAASVLFVGFRDKSRILSVVFLIV